MPDLRTIIKQMIAIEKQSDHEPGAYPIMFKNEFYQIGFIMLLRWERFKRKVKKPWRG